MVYVFTFFHNFLEVSSQEATFYWGNSFPHATCEAVLTRLLYVLHLETSSPQSPAVSSTQILRVLV